MKKYNSNLAFIDLLFNTLVGFTFLFILAFILISPPTPPDKKIDPKAELLIILTWPEFDTSDIDLWVQTPMNKLVGFKNQESGLVHLDRDDRGSNNETILTPSGETVVNHKNQEVVSIRGWIDGIWHVNVHAYRLKASDEKEVPVAVELVQTSPYKIITEAEYTLQYKGEEHTMFNFIVDEVNDEYHVTSITNVQKHFILGGSYDD